MIQLIGKSSCEDFVFLSIYTVAPLLFCLNYLSKYAKFVCYTNFDEPLLWMSAVAGRLSIYRNCRGKFYWYTLVDMDAQGLSAG